MNDMKTPGNEAVNKGAEAMRHGIDAAKEGLSAAGGMVEKTKQRVVDGAHVVDGALHNHPYAAIAIGTGVGVVVGMLLRRCCSR